MTTFVLLQNKNKKAVLSQGNCAMPQLFISFSFFSKNNVKWPFKPFKVIQGHVFWGQWKYDKAKINQNHAKINDLR